MRTLPSGRLERCGIASSFLVSGLLSVLVAVAVLPTGACVETRRGDKKDTPGKNDREFRTIVEKMAQAWERRDLDDIASYYDPKVFGQVLDQAPKTYTGTADLRGAIATALEPIAELHVTLVDDIQVWKESGKVWSLQPFHVNSVLKSGRSVEFDGRHSAIWEKRDGKWVIVYGHFLGSVPQTPKLSVSS